VDTLVPSHGPLDKPLDKPALRTCHSGQAISWSMTIFHMQLA
jgi:hypothetical protein